MPIPPTRTLVVCALAAFALEAAALSAGVAQETPPTRTTSDGVYSSAQSQRGAKLATDTCDVCHGEKFVGTDLGPPVLADGFQANWGGKPLADLFDKIFTTMPAHDPSTLGLTQTTDLVAFLLNLNGYPAGPTDLPGEAAVLQQIQIAARK